MLDRTVNINKLSNNTLVVPEDASLAVSTVPFIVCVCASHALGAATDTAKPNKGVNILQVRRERFRCDVLARTIILLDCENRGKVVKKHKYV